MEARSSNTPSHSYEDGPRTQQKPKQNKGAIQSRVASRSSTIAGEGWVTVKPKNRRARGVKTPMNVWATTFRPQRNSSAGQERRGASRPQGRPKARGDEKQGKARQAAATAKRKRGRRGNGPARQEARKARARDPHSIAPPLPAVTDWQQQLYCLQKDGWEAKQQVKALTEAVGKLQRTVELLLEKDTVSISTQTGSNTNDCAVQTDYNSNDCATETDPVCGQAQDVSVTYISDAIVANYPDSPELVCLSYRLAEVMWEQGIKSTEDMRTLEVCDVMMELNRLRAVVSSCEHCINALGKDAMRRAEDRPQQRKEQGRLITLMFELMP